jgi:hypothetical protein
MTEARRAPAAICRDFEADVLERLRGRRATMHGCPVEAVECRLDGGVAIWFAGPRNGVAWRGALRFDLPWLAQKGLLADPSAVSDVALRLLDTISLDAATPLVARSR